VDAGFAEGRDVKSARATEQLGKNGRFSAETQSAERLLPPVVSKQTEYGAALSQVYGNLLISPSLPGKRAGKELVPVIPPFLNCVTAGFSRPCSVSLLLDRT
jgi:hypothetical protein